MSGHEDVTWAEVNVSNLLAERDQLAATLRQRDVEDGLAATLWTAALAEVTGQRDRARALAVRLEQELAAAESPVPVFDPATVVGNPRCTERGLFGMSDIRCALDAGHEGRMHEWGDLVWA